MERINIKPISLNEAYRGRRFKTDKLKSFKRNVTLQLKPKPIPEGKLQINIMFGFSSKGSDIDNAVKAFLDVLQDVYSFNDNKVYKMILDKTIVKKGNEFIDYEIIKIYDT